METSGTDNPANQDDIDWLNQMAKTYPSLAGPNAQPAPASQPAAQAAPASQPAPAPADGTSPPAYRMAPLGAPIRHLLEGIAGPESGGAYNVRYTGGKPAYFTDYSQHPNIAEHIPGSDLTSTAAGKYQFLGSTWGQVSRQLGLKDFSPASQDQGAAYLARTTYKNATGRDLDSDLADPSKFSTIASTLHGQWPSITGQNVATAMGQPLPPEPNATTPPAPQVAGAPPQQQQTDPRLLAMQQQQLQMQQYNALQKLAQPAQQAPNPWLRGNSWLQPILTSAQNNNPMQASNQAAQEVAMADNQLSPLQMALGPRQASLMGQG